MKIDNSVSSTGPAAPKDATSRTPTAGAPADPGSANTVNLSALSSQMQTASASLANAPVVNQSQVNEIKQAISEGRFKVNPDVVADKLLDTVREIINNKSA